MRKILESQNILKKNQQKLKLHHIFSLNLLQNRKFFRKNGILKPNSLQNSKNARRKWKKIVWQSDLKIQRKIE